MAEWWEEQGYDTEAEAIRDGAKKPVIFSKADARRDTYFKDVKTPQDYFKLISSDSYSPNWTTIGEYRWVEKKFGVNRETAIKYRKGIFPEEPKDEGQFPRLVISEASKTAGIFDETTGEVITEPKEEDVPDDVTGLKRLNATLSLINKQFNNYESLDEYITERPQDIERYIKDNEKVEVLPEGPEEGFVLRIDKNGELEGFDEKTGNTFNPKNTNEITGNDFFKEPIITENQVIIKKTDNEGKTSQTLYIVVGSPGNYTVKAVNPGDEGYESGMSLAAAQATADELNAGFEGETQDDDKTFAPDNPEAIELNNIPVGAEVWDVDGTLYLAYAVPGAGDLYTGSTIWMAYDVVGNDLFEAGLLTAGFEYKGPNGSPSKSWFDSTAVLAGNTNQLIGMDSDPFASFVETYKEEALLRPWLLDSEFIELQAEAALEDRDISEAEWRATTWYQTHSQAERDWMDIELSDPSEAQRQRDDLELYYKNQLQGLGVNNVPDGLIQWVTNKNITGTWSDLKTAEQLQLFADPYKTGERDIEMSNFIATSGFGDVDRTAAREKEVVELYRKWLGPSLGALTQEEVSSIAGRLRDDPDYEDALVNSLKQSRLAAFSNYTNPELTYEDIARPWRNLTTSVWGQTADETQGWWQDMVKSNDFTAAQTTLREKGLEQDITQVTQDATKALQQALGQGQIVELGANI